VLGAAFGIYTMIRRLIATEGLAPPADGAATMKEGDQ